MSPECCRAGWPTGRRGGSGGGMGQRAMALFEEKNIRVVVGLAPDTPERLVEQYLEGTLKSGTNVCDH